MMTRPVGTDERMERTDIQTRVIKRLRMWGWTFSDIGDVWGFTRQRVNQLLVRKAVRDRATPHELHVIGRVMSRLYAAPFRWPQSRIARVWNVPNETVRNRIRKSRGL